MVFPSMSARHCATSGGVPVRLFGNIRVVFDVLQYSVPCSGRSGEAERPRANRAPIEAEMSSTEPGVEGDGDGLEGVVFLG
jgi:hypothetical protein